MNDCSSDDQENLVASPSFMSLKESNHKKSSLQIKISSIESNSTIKNDAKFHIL